MLIDKIERIDDGALLNVSPHKVPEHKEWSKNEVLNRHRRQSIEEDNLRLMDKILTV